MLDQATAPEDPAGSDRSGSRDYHNSVHCHKLINTVHENTFAMGDEVRAAWDPVFALRITYKQATNAL